MVETDGRVVGDLKLAVLDAWAQEQVRSQAAGTEAEVGWILDPAVQGQGLATEAMRSASAHGASGAASARRRRSRTDSSGKPSSRAWRTKPSRRRWASP